MRDAGVRRFLYADIQEERRMVEELARQLNSCHEAKDLCLGRGIHGEIQHRFGGNRYLSNLLVQMYGKCGAVEDAKQVFDATASKNIYSWCILVSGYAHNGYMDDAEAALRLMPVLNTLVPNAVISGYAQVGCLQQARRSFETMASRDVVSWTALLHGYAENGERQEARRCFDKMPQHNVIAWTARVTMLLEADRLVEARQAFDSMAERNSISWTALLSGYARAGQLLEAEAVLNRMPCCDPVGSVTMLQAYIDYGDVEGSGKQSFNEMQQRNLVAWNCLAWGHADKGEVEATMEVVERMPQYNVVSWTAVVVVNGTRGRFGESKAAFDGIVNHTVVSFTAMVKAYAENGRLEEAEEVFHRMPEQDRVSRNLMIGLYAERGMVVKAKNIFDVLVVDRDVVSWNAMLIGLAEAAAKAGSSSLTELDGPLTGVDPCPAWLFDRMPMHDVVSWNTFIGACCGSDVWRAKKAFDVMPERNAVSWKSLLSAFARSGHLLQEAEDVLRKMPRADTTCWNTMVGAYTHTGNVEDAERVFSAMPDKDIVSWNSLVSLYARNGFPDVVVHIFSWLSLDGLQPDATSVLALLLGYSHCGMVMEASLTVGSMQVDYGVDPSREHFCCIVDALARVGRLEEAEELLQTMPFAPDEVAWVSLLSGCGTCSDVERGGRAAQMLLLSSVAPDFSNPGAAYVLLANHLAASLGFS